MQIKTLSCRMRVECEETNLRGRRRNSTKYNRQHSNRKNQSARIVFDFFDKPNSHHKKNENEPNRNNSLRHAARERKSDSSALRPEIPLDSSLICFAGLCPGSSFLSPEAFCSVGWTPCARQIQCVEQNVCDLCSREQTKQTQRQNGTHPQNLFCKVQPL